jgi:hypothetical protein
MGYNPGYVDGNLIATNSAYVPGAGLFKVIDNVGGGVAYWIYITSDTLASVLASGYVTDATFKRLKVGDIVDVFSGTLASEAATATTGAKLGVVTFPAEQGVASLFTAQPTYQRMIVASVTAATTTTSGVGTLAIAELGLTNLVSNPRNMFDGGDATINPWQRGTSITGIVATNTYTADRWFMVAGSSSSASMVKTANTTVPGFSQAFVWGRGQSSGIASSITVGQALESLDSIRAQGQVVTFSFWAAANTGYTISSSPLAITLAQGFGTDQSASALVNGTWTSQSNVISATQVLTTTLTRYSFVGVVSNTATQLGLLLSYTAGNTTATTAENVIMNGLQLEIGGLTPFEHREIEQELAYCQRYYFQVNEPGTGVFVAAGTFEQANSAIFLVTLPVQMRVAPTVTVTQGSFGAQSGGSYIALTTFAAGTTHTVNYVSVNGLATQVSGFGAILVGGSANQGTIKVSADL